MLRIEAIHEDRIVATADAERATGNDVFVHGYRLRGPPRHRYCIGVVRCVEHDRDAVDVVRLRSDIGGIARTDTMVGRVRAMCGRIRFGASLVAFPAARRLRSTHPVFHKDDCARNKQYSCEDQARNE